MTLFDRFLLLLTPVICVLALLFNSQDFLHLNQFVYGAVTEDPLSFSMILHRMSENLLNFHSLWDGKYFYPYKQSLLLSEPLFLSSLFYRFFYAFTSKTILSLNLTILLFFLLNYFSMFLSCRLFLKPHASILASTIFAFNMLRLGHLCHIHVLPQFMFPLTIFFIFLYEKKQQNRYLLFSVLALSAQFYFSLSLGILLFVNLLPYALWKIYTRKVSFRKSVLLILLFIVTTAPLLFNFYQNSHAQGFHRTLADSKIFRASPLSYFTPPLNHFYEKIFFFVNFQDIARQEKSLFIGFLCFALTVVGLSLLKKEKNKYYPIILISFLFTIILSMGSYLGLYNLLFYLVPLMKGIRTPARFALTYLFLCSLLSAYAFEKLTQQNTKFKPSTFFALFLILFLLENNFQIPKTEVTNSWANAVQYLSSIPKKEPTIFYPMDTEESYHMYASTLHNHPIANGWAGFTPQSYYTIKNYFKNLEELQRLGFKNIAFRKDFLDFNALEKIKKRGKLIFEDTFCFIIYLGPI